MKLVREIKHTDWSVMCLNLRIVLAIIWLRGPAMQKAFAAGLALSLSLVSQFSNHQLSVCISLQSTHRQEKKSL